MLSTSPIPLKFYIVGYADERGNESFNRELSWMRVNAVSTYLKKPLLLTRPTPFSFPVQFVMDGAGEGKGLFAGSKLCSQDDSVPLGLTHRDLLARWRRVSINRMFREIQ